MPRPVVDKWLRAKDFEDAFKADLDKVYQYRKRVLAIFEGLVSTEHTRVPVQVATDSARASDFTASLIFRSESWGCFAPSLGSSESSSRAMRMGAAGSQKSRCTHLHQTGACQEILRSVFPRSDAPPIPITGIFTARAA